MPSKERKQKKHKDEPSQSLSNFHNLELLCKADDKQKKTLQKIIKHKPELARSLNIYADGVQFYLEKQKQKKKFLQQTLELDESIVKEEVKPLVLPLLTKRREILKEKQFQRIASETPDKDREIPKINPVNYTPFASRQRVQIASLAAPKATLGKELHYRLKFNYYVCQGNNGKLVQQVLNKRENYWSQVPLSFAYKHFTWQQNSNTMEYQKMNPNDGVYSRVMCNFFEFHKNITSKTGLVQAVSALCPLEKTFNIMPLVFLVNFKLAEWPQDLSIFTEYFLKHNPKPNTTTKMGLDFFISNINHPPLNYQGIQNVPLTPTLTGDQYLWLLKPADWNRGEGVHVFNTLTELEDLIRQYYYAKGNYECKEFVIQKYIERPLLLKDRKFDIRCWVLLTQDNTFHLFEEAYIRTSGSAFTLDNKDKFIHLTNNAIQKNSTSYGQFENGNQLSLKQFQNILTEQGTEFDFRSAGWTQIKEYVRIVMQSRLNRRQRKYCMQVFGYDFMIDAEKKVWLIEVNANPCLEESSPLLQQLIPRMLDDAFKLTIDRVFTPEVSYQHSFPVDGYDNNHNMWELLGSQ